MTEEFKFTNEAKLVFKYIQTELIEQFPVNIITPNYFIYSVLCNKETNAFKVLEEIFVEENLKVFEMDCYNSLTNSTSSTGIKSKFDPLYDVCLSECGKEGHVIDSCSFLISLITNDKSTAQLFSKFGITIEELKNKKPVVEETVAKEKPKIHKKIAKKNVEEKKKSTPKPVYENNEVEKNLVNISKLAEEGKVEEVIDNEEVIDRIFGVLMKRERNNVILVGEPGSGKTCTVKHIANLIMNGSVPKYFSNKTLMKLDFISLLTGTGFRGGFEAKYQSIVECASKLNKYIFFLDDIHSILSPNSKFSEVSTDVMLDDILTNKNIMFIATTTFEGYSKYIASNKTLSRRFEKIVLKEKKGDVLQKVMNRVAEKYETFHNVKFTEEVIEKSIELSDRFLGGSNIYTVADILDTSAANELIKQGEDPVLTKLKGELTEINNSIEDFKSSTNSYEEYDTLCKKQIEKQSEINKYEKESLLNKKPIKVHLDSLYKTISEKTGIAVGNITTSESERLKNLDKSLRKKVIGQDEAIDVVSRAVRRQRVGLGNPDKPVVLFFAGESGVGKTFLAKKLNEEVFGDEKTMVRLDMSEYADKISANKLIGSANGYVGYEEGGLLTEAIKKNNHCVLLLDEIEKANDEIFNIFLQVFDEGRLTDNKGVTVDFRNVIIIMTSNIGTKEASQFHPIGFGDKKEEIKNQDIIIKTIKKRLPPEFINRVDNFIFFNKLTDDNLKEIIKIEIGRVRSRVQRMGFDFDKSIIDGVLTKNIFKEVKKQSEYGARPILREIQRQLEDKLTDFLLENKVKKGYCFKIEDVLN